VFKSPFSCMVWDKNRPYGVIHSLKPAKTSVFNSKFLLN
jgi:hypothetical protein